MENLKSTVLASRASGTSENYLKAFNKWRTFASDVLGTSEFPVRPIDCALYLQHLLESTKSVATINCAFYAFRWIHLLAGVDSPTLHPTVVAVKEGAVRLASQPIVNRKEPLHADHLKLLAAETNLEDLLQSRNRLAMFILAFFGSLKSLSRILYLISLGLVPIELRQDELLYLPAVAFSERNIQRNGRWASVTAKRIYVKYILLLAGLNFLCVCSSPT